MAPEKQTLLDMNLKWGQMIKWMALLQHLPFFDIDRKTGYASHSAVLQQCSQVND